MSFLKKHSFLDQGIDDFAYRLTAVSDIVAHLEDVRVIVSLAQLQQRFHGTKIPIDELCDDDHVESSVQRDRFKYIPKITKMTAEFINNKVELLAFLTRHPNGIKLLDLIDAYKGLDRDLYALAQSGVVILINPKENKHADGSKVMSAETAARKAREISERPKWYIDEKKDPRVVYPAKTWLVDETLLLTGTDEGGEAADPIQPLEQKYVDLWMNAKTPHTMAQVKEVLIREKHEVLPDKASR